MLDSGVVEGHPLQGGVIMYFSKTFTKATEAQITELEASREFDLPTDFRNYLREVGGGIIGSGGYIELPYPNSSIILAIKGFTQDPLFNIRRNRFNNFSKVIDRKFLYVASDIGRQAVIMDLRLRFHGHIYYYDPDEIPLKIVQLDDTGFDKHDYEEATLYHHIADSFTEFLAMLGPDPLDE